MLSTVSKNSSSLNFFSDTCVSKSKLFDLDIEKLSQEFPGRVKEMGDQVCFTPPARITYPPNAAPHVDLGPQMEKLIRILAPVFWTIGRLFLPVMAGIITFSMLFVILIGRNEKKEANRPFAIAALFAITVGTAVFLATSPRFH